MREMSGGISRRMFQRGVLAVAGGVMVRGVGAEESPRIVVRERAGAGGAPVIVVGQSVAEGNRRGRAWMYIGEVLRRAGVFFEQRDAGDVGEIVRRTGAVVVLAGDLRLTAEQRRALAEWVGRGGALVGIGGTSGLEEVFGAAGSSALAEGWMVVGAKEHPVLAGLRSSLHVFGGQAIRPAGTATVLAGVEAGRKLAMTGAILENRFGKGRALLIGPDLLFSIVHIQQGLPVLQDGRPAEDGTGPVNDGILKAEDGMALDWGRDRQAMPVEGRAFLESVSDELREIILRSIFYLAREGGIAVAALWYWPEGLKAVAHLSHDTDGNIPKLGEALLEVMNGCGVKSTWCTLYPGGYAREFYGRLAEQGYEIALHFDALTGGRETSWSKENFLLQHEWLKKEAGVGQVTTNKNHYTRWEGRLELYRWCMEAGIASDQTRGPSKKGTIGFPLGGAQPYFPLDDEAERPTILPVLEVNLMTQDLIVTCPAEYGAVLADAALSHHGVAHFLFHPNHILKPGVAEALRGVVEHARAKGMAWWTSRQIYEWEVARRGVRAEFGSEGKLTLRAERPVRGATLLVMKGKEGRRGERWMWQGFEFEAVRVDVEGEVRVTVG